eukprot:6901365-Pyramimonas_sp.AAC.1
MAEEDKLWNSHLLSAMPIEADAAATEEEKQSFQRLLAKAFRTWISLILKMLLAAGAAVFAALGVVLYPISLLVPASAIKILFKAVFRIGYTFYVFTPLGRWIHMRMVRSRRKNHTPHHTINIHPTHLSTCDVIPVPILTDNYGYFIIDRATKQCAAVDPADPELVCDLLERRNLTLTMILTTHQHHDHAGGNLALKEAFPDVVVVGGKKDKCAGVTKEVCNGERLTFGETSLQV